MARQIRVDRDLLKQAVLNVVVNAIEAMPEGGELRLESSASRGRGGDPGIRYRRRHSAGAARQDFPPLFHHQEGRLGHRAGHDFPDRAASRWYNRFHQRTGQRHYLSHTAAACGVEHLRVWDWEGPALSGRFFYEKRSSHSGFGDGFFARGLRGARQTADGEIYPARSPADFQGRACAAAGAAFHSANTGGAAAAATPESGRGGRRRGARRAARAALSTSAQYYHREARDGRSARDSSSKT